MIYILKSNLVFNLLWIILLVSSTSACSTIGYYTQSIQGQLEIIHKSVPLEQALDNNDLPREVASQLINVRNIRNFATNELGLPDNNSYRRYADLERKYVVWNVFASPELFLENREWCYLIIGCLGYRGYFSENDARKLASELEDQGYDVFVGGVSAYSTLGWFADPVLNTMLHWDTTYLAKVIFHELAHQKVYIKNDTEFNEAFADTVAMEGVERWLEKYGSAQSIHEFSQKQSRENMFVNLVLRYRKKLDAIYRSSLLDKTKRQKKNIILQNMVNEYQNIRSDWGNDSTYDNWFAMGVNNAKLMAVVTYRELVPGFQKFLQAANNNLNLFYKLITNLGHCDHNLRRKILFSGNIHFSC